MHIFTPICGGEASVIVKPVFSPDARESLGEQGWVGRGVMAISLRLC